MLRRHPCSNNHCQEVTKYARACKEIIETTEMVVSRGLTEKLFT